MATGFQYDVFLSHSAKDKAVLRPLAKRLRKDGLKVWLDEWEIKPGDSIPAKIEEGLGHSRVLVLYMSASAFGSDWAQLEAGTYGRGNLPLSRPAEPGAPLHSPAARRHQPQPASQLKLHCLMCLSPSLQQAVAISPCKLTQISASITIFF
jgi:hypothetical protein